MCSRYDLFGRDRLVSRLLDRPARQPATVSEAGDWVAWTPPTVAAGCPLTDAGSVSEGPSVGMVVAGSTVTGTSVVELVELSGVLVELVGSTQRSTGGKYW